MKRFVPKKFKVYFSHLLKSNSTTPEVADGLAIGMFVGWLPVIGLQMYIALVLTRLFKRNTIAGVMAVFVTNPITAFPIYFFNLWVGNFFYSKESVTFLQLYETVKTLNFRDILVLGQDVLVPLWTGSVLIGLIMAWISQRLCLRYYDRIKKKFHHLAEHLHHHHE